MNVSSWTDLFYERFVLNEYLVFFEFKKVIKTDDNAVYQSIWWWYQLSKLVIVLCLRLLLNEVEVDCYSLLVPIAAICNETLLWYLNFDW